MQVRWRRVKLKYVISAVDVHQSRTVNSTSPRKTAKRVAVSLPLKSDLFFRPRTEVLARPDPVPSSIQRRSIRAPVSVQIPDLYNGSSLATML